MVAWAKAGVSAPARLVPSGESFVEWTQYPAVEALDKSSGWKFYYHAHPRSERLGREHGHFHIFVPGPHDAHDGVVLFSHLIGISVDQQGLPLRLFTTNQWVTGESWQPAEALVDVVKSPGFTQTQPADVAGWLGLIITLYTAEICALLQARDKRLQARALMIRTNPYEDRRLRIPSQRHINLLHRISREKAVQAG
ncbi:MAG: hypothetical protein POG24_02375 [Acidocella sp.]|nr:hypothetical protein [Acidocella sp.]